jgi:REP-associated tyrosine transposase
MWYVLDMARLRKRHLQQELFGARNGQPTRLGRDGRVRRRRKPGRKPSRRRPSEPHKTRPELKARCPVHVALRVVPAVGSLRRRDAYRAIREATITVALRELNAKETGAFRIVHASIQRTHVHLLVEADHKMALSRGMQSFQISAAKHLNRACSKDLDERRRGTVFPDRFHQEIIETPTQARHALSYVLNNWRKHREDRGRSWNVDPFSTGVLFSGWKQRADSVLLWHWRDSYQPLVVYLPKTWLLRIGWQRGGALVDWTEVPSRRLFGP